LRVVERSVLGVQEGGGEIEPVEALSATFLQNLVSYRMDVDLGDEYEERVHKIVQELEASGREAGLEESPSRTMKEELEEIEIEETSRESRKVGDGKVSSESAEEIDRIVIEDSMEGESYMIRTVGQEEDDEPVPHRNVLTPVMESTPIEGRDKEGGRIGFRPLTAPKEAMWVQPESDKKEPEEEDGKSSSGESSVSRRSPMSAVSSGRLRAPENEVPLHLRAPQGYGDRATRVQVRFNERTGLREISEVEGGGSDVDGRW